MVPWLVLAGIILAPSAAFFLWSWRSQRNDIALMRATETTRAGDVAKLPAGSLVEVKGRLRCASPVTGDLSNSPCAHFAATVERDYEIVEYDASRKTSYRVRKTEIVRSTTLFAPFEIEDDSGRARVLPADATSTWSARTAASKRRRPAPRGSAFSSASNPRRRARRSSAAPARGCWGSASPACSVRLSAWGQPGGWPESASIP